jgi:D-alanyl-D-alanine carboxypeptidase (penicillin-binding protein 5/6)
VLGWRSDLGNWRRRWPSSRALVLAAALAAALIVAAPSPPVAASAASVASVSSAAAGPAVQVKGGALVEVDTGRRLWSVHPYIARPMGSITKVMTALVVLKAGDLNREIRVTSDAVRYVRSTGASSAGLIAGDVLTARQLLEAMLLPSGCDAAYMLATAYGPGRPAFIRKMNAMARSMDLMSSHFASFDGMPFPTEYSTYSSPADLIRIGERAMRNSVFRGIVAQRRFYLPATARHHAYLWHTTDSLIGSYRGAIGIKTGNTIAAGYCLLFEARRKGRTLIGVVLHADPSSGGLAAAVAAAESLLNWGFRQV